MDIDRPRGAQKGNQNAKKPEEERRNIMMNFRVTKAEKLQIKADAKSASMRINEYIRKKLEIK